MNGIYEGITNNGKNIIKISAPNRMMKSKIKSKAVEIENICLLI